MNNRKLGRKADHRKALLRNQATSLILHGQIETTQMKAMELRSVVDELITLAKRNDLHARRQAAKVLFNSKNSEGKTALQVLFEEVGPRYAERQGGYTKVIKLDTPRRGDAAEVALIKLV